MSQWIVTADAKANTVLYASWRLLDDTQFDIDALKAQGVPLLLYVEELHAEALEAYNAPGFGLANRG